MVEAKERTHILSPNPLQSWSLDPLETPEPPQTETVTKTTLIISVYITYIAHAYCILYMHVMAPNGLMHNSLNYDIHEINVHTATGLYRFPRSSVSLVW